MLKNSIIYTTSSILSATIPFILLPILTRYFSPEQYGQIAMFNILTGVLGALIGVSVHGAANRRFFDEGVSRTDLARFNGNCFLILLSTSVLLLGILTFFDNFLAAYLGIPTVWTYFGVVSVFSSFVLNIRLGQWQVRGKAKQYACLQIINSLIILVLSLLFVIYLEFGPDGRIYGMVLTSVIISIVSFFTLRSDGLILIKYSRKDVSAALSFGLPLIPHVIGGFLLLSIDRLVISKELGLEVTGIYMVAMSLGNALNVMFNSVNKAYSPWLFGKLKENNHNEKKKIVKNTYLYFMFLLAMGFLSFFVTPPILKLIVGDDFFQASEILPLIMLGQIFLGMYFMVTNYIFYVKKTKYLSYVTMSSGVINIVLLLLLIPIYGVKGAAFSFLVANFCQFLCTWVISAGLCKMPWAIWIK